MDHHDDIFATTRWTAVRLAGRSDSTRARRALGELCQTYWFPLYAYVRRRGRTPPDAEDLTQGFFARLLRLESLATVSQEKGKFRAFLLAAMNNYLAAEHARDSAQKRAKDKTIALDADSAEHRYAHAPVEHLTAERLFERQWALTLLGAVVQRLHDEYAAAGRGDAFLALRFSITAGDAAIPYAEVAATLETSEENVKVMVHRLRRRYRQALREEIAQTVPDPAEVDEELRYLRRVLSV